jgi:putative molybdopterin biosynthesis protein
MLLDYELGRQGICADGIAGYEQEVGTHMAVAASIAAGAADAGLGIRAAANALGLDFIPVGNEQYDLLLGFASSDAIVRLIADILQSTEFREEVEKLGGYDLSTAGVIRAEGKDNGN